MFQAMQQHIASSLHQYKHQSMANTIWALAKLSGKGSAAPAAASSTASTTTGSTSSTVSSDLVAALVARCQPQMHFWSARDLSQAAWGLARLGAKPSQQWCKVSNTGMVPAWRSTLQPAGEERGGGLID
jgi:hypothetical protein